MVLITEYLYDLLFYIQPPTHVIKICIWFKEEHDLGIAEGHRLKSHRI